VVMMMIMVLFLIMLGMTLTLCVPRKYVDSYVDWMNGRDEWK